MEPEHLSLPEGRFIRAAVERSAALRLHLLLRRSCSAGFTFPKALPALVSNATEPSGAFWGGDRLDCGRSASPSEYSQCPFRPSRRVRLGDVGSRRAGRVRTGTESPTSPPHREADSPFRRDLSAV